MNLEHRMPTWAALREQLARKLSNKPVKVRDIETPSSSTIVVGGTFLRYPFVVPGGGVSRDGSSWLQVKPDRLFHPLPAKKLYKQRFVEAIREAGLYDQLPYGVLKCKWVVNIKPVGNGEAALKYLAPYVYRVA